MPTKMLTDLFCERVKPPAEGRAEYFDAVCDGLALRVSATGHKAWSYYYRLEGKHRRYTIGTFPTIKPVQARRLAGAALELVRSGSDPSAQKRAAREAGPPDQDTFAALAQDYLDQHARKNTAPGTYKETKRALQRDVVPSWRNRPIGSITRGDVNKLIDAIAARGAPVQANRTLAHVRKVFNWARGKDRVQATPADGVKPPARERARDRVLSDDELRWFWTACEVIGWPFGPLVKLLLLTAQRRDEVGGMEWSEIDFDRRVWTIPSHRTKNNRAHEVQLSEPALKILQSLPRGKAGKLVFTTNGETPVSGFSRAKRRLDVAMALARRCALALPTEDAQYRKLLGIARGKPLPVEIQEWILHDLRRTAATGMARLKIPPHEVDKLLNHASGTIRGVAAVYNRFEYLEERRAALEAWGRFVSDLFEPVPANVVALRARGGS